LGVALERTVVLILGGGETLTPAEAVFEVSATEAAVTVMLRLAEDAPGALYVVAVAVVLVKVPQPVPAHPVPEALQVTPFALESFSTVAVKFTLCP